MLTVETRTNPGPRTTNEDSVLWDPDLALMVIADGTRGHNAGEVASRVAIDAAQEFLRKTVKEADATFAYGVNSALSLTENRLLNAVKVANRQIFSAGQKHAEVGMGTTVVVALVEGRHLTLRAWATAGYAAAGLNACN
jgi:protein phosphatase